MQATRWLEPAEVAERSFGAAGLLSESDRWRS